MSNLFKVITMGAPWVKVVCMGRALMIPEWLVKILENG
jgi:hypothetical protein